MTKADRADLSTSELARRWNVHAETLRKWRMLGLGPPYYRPSGKPRGRVRYRVSDIERWERSNKVRAKRF